MANKHDDIELLILNNLDKLSNREPQEGHFDRFEQKLVSQPKTKKINLNLVWKVAVAIVFIFLAVNQAIIYLSPEKEIINSLSNISPEYSEVEMYYTSEINSGLNQWNAMWDAGLVTLEEKEMMDSELKEFDEMYTNLQVELQANPYDERVINAMLGFYQSKLDVINMIIQKLQEVKSQNQIDDEYEV